MFVGVLHTCPKSETKKKINVKDVFRVESQSSLLSLRTTQVINVATKLINEVLEVYVY